MSTTTEAAARPAVPPGLEQTRIVAILRHTAPEMAVQTAEALVDGGVHAVEVTLNSADAVRMLRAIAEALRERVVLGAGTVLDREGADAAIDAGVAFIVSPHTDPDLVRHVARRGIPCLPGAFSATEVLAAWSAGASVVKLFPAGSVGPAYLKDLRGPLAHVPFMPTGGVTLENAEAFMRAGAWGLGVGSALVDPTLVAQKRFGELTRRAAALAAIVRR